MIDFSLVSDVVNTFLPYVAPAVGLVLGLGVLVLLTRAVVGFFRGGN